MLKRLTVVLVSLCTLCGAASASRQEQKPAEKAQKAARKEQKKKIKKETRYFEKLRNQAVVDFAKANPPSQVISPAALQDLRISDIICVGDKTTGTVVLHMNVTPLFGRFRLFMGGANNGTQAIAGDEHYPSTDIYGRIYTLRSGLPEQVIVLFNGITAGTPRLNRVDISMGLSLNILNLITLKNVPIFWTYSDNAIKNYVRETANEQTAN